jgi:dTDP-4-dehydrorhamnose 3,5-epimerase
MDGVILTPLKQIHHPRGDIFHAMKASDDGFSGFGEAYFSTVNKGETKGWKKHTRMTLNIVVPIGAIDFVIYNEKSKQYFRVTLSNKNYQRLTINPDLWVSFTGVKESNMLLNIANIEHDLNESFNIDLDAFNY